ncbi:MAG: hypothetical protein K6F35_07165 [Lachnospiraceae bacterium]|nr:hypothetical protein [Lachnospiraceae bacterium]
MRAGYAKAGAEDLPGYVNVHLVRNRGKKEETPDLSKPLNEEKNPWINEDGSLNKEIRLQDVRQSKTLMDAIGEIPGEEKRERLKEEAQASLKVLNEKRRLQAIREYKKSDSSSSYQMKKAKADLAREVEKDREAMKEEASAEYREILQQLLEYTGIITTAQYEIRDFVRKQTEDRQHPDLYVAEKTLRERALLKEICARIQEKLGRYRDALIKGTEVSEAELEEVNVLSAYLEKLDGMCDGKLKVPDGEKKVVDDADLFEVKLDKEKTDFVLVSLSGFEKNKKGADIKTQPNFRFKDAELRIRFNFVQYRFRDEADTPLFPHEPCMENVCQGLLGDCYAMAAMASLVERKPEAIKEMMKDNGNGTVTVRLYNTKREPVYITVKKSVPVDPSIEDDNKDYYARNCLWIQMIEKAFAASGIAKEYRNWDDKLPEDMEDKQFIDEKLEMNGLLSYDAIRGGNALFFISVLTGAEKEDIKKYSIADHAVIERRKALSRNIKDGTAGKDALDAELKTIIQRIRKAEADGKPILASTRNDLPAVDGTGQSAGEHIMRGISGKEDLGEEGSG